MKVSNDVTNINDLLEEIYSVFKPRIKPDINFILTKGLDNKSVVVLTDVAKLRQILFNLLSNALKFTDQGYIEFGYYIKQNKLKFYVEDTGIGIKNELHEKIFERFQKADNNVMKLYDGVGLGLAICKGNVDLLGGKIGVESEEGKGSRFYFTIPYISNHKNDVQLPEELITTSLKGNSVILVVEDDKANINYIKEILKRAGISFALAENGQEAVEICRNQKNIFLVLMDLKMPVMDGYQATRQIKNFRADLPIVAQTAFAFEEEKQKVLNSGFDNYISNPFNREELLRIIKEYQHYS